MKKCYESPRLYMEEFIPNEYAVLCAPGIDESKAKPFTQTCYYYGKHYQDNGIWVQCSEQGENLAFLTTETTGCRMKLDSNGNVSGTGVTKVSWDFEHPYSQHSACKQDGYKWSNQAGGYHYVPVAEFGGTTNGKPTYFNS